MIMLSRNTPVALVVGAAGFIGSFLCEDLLDKEIQVVGLDNLSTGFKENLVEASKYKNFHFVNQSALDTLPLGLPRVDYAFFLLPEHLPTQEYQRAFHNFLQYVKQFNSKVVLVSTIDAYDSHKKELNALKEAEKRLAFYAKDHHANARIVRLAPIYGPRMTFAYSDPMSKIIQAALDSDLQRQTLSLDFTTRSLYINDAIQMLVKSVFLGGTAHKIYDAALLHPIKVSEVGQVLLDPLWYETRGFIPTLLPPWPTPNLARTMKELSWKPTSSLVQNLKKTITFYKEHESQFRNSKVGESEQYFAPAMAPAIEQLKESEAPTVVEEKRVKKGSSKKLRIQWGYISKNRGLLLGLCLIVLGIVYPTVDLLVSGLSIRWHLKNSSQYLVDGDFDNANKEIGLAEGGVSQIKMLLSSMALLEKVPPLAKSYQTSEQLVDMMEETVQASEHAVVGTQALYQSAKVISGTGNDDLKTLFSQAETEFSTADRMFSQVQAGLDDPTFKNSLPSFVQTPVDDLQTKVNGYQEIITKGKSVAYILPQVVALDGKKSYLVLLQNNMELRSGGGFIGSYAQVDFDHGKMTNLKVDDVYNLDGQLKDTVTPPKEISDDLGQKSWYLRDVNTEPDFPTNAKLADWFYRKESGTQVSGVVALDLSASQKLLGAIGPLDLPDYQEKIDQNNLFERAIAHAEVSFFAGSQAKRNFLTALETELFNHIFFLPKQNWPDIIKAVGSSLDEKHIMVYLSDPTLFSYLTSQGWSGVLPRQAKATEGERDEFLAVDEANLGANKVNYYLQRSTELKTRISKEGQVDHTLTIHYFNQSPTDVWPGGQYKNRIKIYLPSGTKVTKATWGGSDILNNITSFTDYGRAGFTTLLVLQPKEKKDLYLEYTDATPLDVTAGNQIKMHLDVWKQPGTVQDKFDYTLGYSLNFKPENVSTQANQELNFSTDLTRDRSFDVTFVKTQ